MSKTAPNLVFDEMCELISEMVSSTLSLFDLTLEMKLYSSEFFSSPREMICFLTDMKTLGDRDFWARISMSLSVCNCELVYLFI